MKRQKLNKTLKPPKDQTRLAAIPMVFTPEECLRLIADFTPQLKPALVETMDLAQSASIRKSSAVFVFPNDSTNWVFERLGKAVREINNTCMASLSVNSKKVFSSPVTKSVSFTDRISILVRAG